jgi:ParB family chromosome partitioning protein
MEIEISKIHPFKNHPFKVLDDDAIVVMVDANIQREELLPSEKAFAYKMKLEAMKRQGVRTDLTCVQSEHKLGKKSRELLGEQVGISSVQVTRYIRLTELIPELLDLVDNKKLQFTVAVDISYIDKEVQEWIYEYISDTGFIKPKQIDGPINQIQMLSIFNNCVMAKKVSRSLTFSEL